ncbi:replication initiation protein [Thalassospira profundimaris]|uniref:replication initiation protein n=1 Tax=Thalassospira profundimaris TaxID=502049 RepID=UPI0015F0BA97|nr:replication initiation protein [Thalassospira profundimaris]
MTNLDFKTYLNTRTQLVSDDVKSSRACSWVEPTGYAESRKYVSLNPGHCKKVRFLTIDCDHPDFDEIPGSFPKPLCTVISRGSGRHHHIFELNTPVLTDINARMKPKRLLASVEKSFIKHLGGDENFTNRLSKNPWNTQEWSTIWYPDFKPIELKDCLVWCDIEPSNDNRKLVVVKTSGYSRNVDLFDHVRLLAYQHYFGSWNENDSEVYNVAFGFNSSLQNPLPDSEVRSTCKSIIKFMNERYTGSNSEPYARKTVSVDDKINIIREAIETAKSDSVIYNKEYLSEVTGIPYSTLRRLWSKV